MQSHGLNVTWTPLGSAPGLLPEQGRRVERTFRGHRGGEEPPGAGSILWVNQGSCPLGDSLQYSLKVLKRSEIVNFRGGLLEKCIAALWIPQFPLLPDSPSSQGHRGTCLPFSSGQKDLESIMHIPCTLGISNLVSDSSRKAKDGGMSCVTAF